MAEDRSLILKKQNKGKKMVIGKNHLLAIGIDAYHHCPVLKNAVKDATDLVNTLTGEYGFYADNIRLITNEEASEQRIFSEFRNLIKEVKPEDNVMIFFCGHGHYDEDFKQGYWIPVDARAGEIGDYIPNSEISTTIRAIPSRHTFMIADACFSGSLFGESRSVVSTKSPTQYHRKVEALPSRWGLASGRNEIVSDGAVGENSPFTQNLIYFLEHNTGSPFAVSELVQYVKVATANNSEQTPIGSPLRNVGDRGGEFIFYPGGRAQEEEIASAQQHVSSSAPAHREIHESVHPQAISPVARVLEWANEHYQMILLMVASTLFLGLWNGWLFLVLPLVIGGIIFVTKIFKLEGVVKTRTVLLILVVATLEFVRSDWDHFSNNCWKQFSTNSEAFQCFFSSISGRAGNHEFLWFSLGAGCLGGFFYFFFKK